MTEENCKQQFLKPCSAVVHLMAEIVLSVLLHLPKIRICKNGENIS